MYTHREMNTHAPPTYTHARTCILTYVGNKSEAEKNLVGYSPVTRNSIRVEI